MQPSRLVTGYTTRARHSSMQGEHQNAIKVVCTVQQPGLLMCTVQQPGLLMCTVQQPGLLMCTVQQPGLLMCTVQQPGLLMRIMGRMGVLLGNVGRMKPIPGVGRHAAEPVQPAHHSLGVWGQALCLTYPPPSQPTADSLDRG